MVVLRITVTLKKAVEDSEGSSVLKALRLLGYDNVREVRSGKVYFITLTKGSKKAGKEFCEKLLANPVINECVVDD
ncbi:MAG: phosphoribosylformylglycinamidine synthase subunit PurS [Thermoplasmatales archaeon]|jgi:phosphoribosylformylglycinamidine synthase|nr:phosphoribosylformylglycinamidine synthase subunit PurS [Candidatus Thermoplasmatota archaeon]MCL6002756.1 phosphoribosylformylglycinamidine synthase subunit PurS [Candidatus Thermoplasmatota archaeon]MDA8054858.1 phosphoribosylformylglycinamidine synthase subunit PurS [Thermoplasmatales archaeon]